MHSWQFEENFVANAGKVYSILTDSSKKNKQFSFDRMISLAKEDELYAFALQLLLQEQFCQMGHMNRHFSQLVKSIASSLPSVEDFIAIEEWLRRRMAGLTKSPFPSVEYLLKKQVKPSHFTELDLIFRATKFLNKITHEFNPNSSKSDIQHLIQQPDYEIYQRLPDAIKDLMNISFSFEIPKLEDAPFCKSTSYRDLLFYIDFESRSEFRNIPSQLLEIPDGFDYGAPFGKRWARKLAAKPLAFGKMFYDPLSQGVLPQDLSKSFENAINFDIQFPEGLNVELMHQNFFESTQIGEEISTFCSFSAAMAKYFNEIPSILTRPLKNIDIFKHAPSGKNAKPSCLASFKALLLVLGLKGHLTLKSLPPVDVHEILNFDCEGISSCLLLGLAAAVARSRAPSDAEGAKFLFRLFSLHLPSFQSFLEFDVPLHLQSSAIMAMGLSKFQSFDRSVCQLLLKEIFRPLPRNVNLKAKDSPLLCYIPALALGMILMGANQSESIADHHFASDILLQLNSSVSGRTQFQVSALISLAFIALNGSAKFVHEGSFPWSRSLPDLLDKPEPIVFWTILSWRMVNNWCNHIRHLNDQGCDRVVLDFHQIFDSVCQPASDSVWTNSSELSLFIYACQVLSANALFTAIRYANEIAPEDLIHDLSFWIEKMRSLHILFNFESDFFIAKIQMHLLTTYQYLILAKCIMASGSGDLQCWRLLRELMAHPLLFKWGNSRLFFASLGFLFANEGRSQIKTIKNGKIDYLAVAGLICSLFPLFPTSPCEAEYTLLTLIDHFWVFAMDSK